MYCNMFLLSLFMTVVTVDGFFLSDIFHSTTETGCSSYFTYPNYNVTRNGKCYEFILQQKVDWAHAQLDCRRKGGALLTVEDGEEHIFIFQQLHHHLFSDKGVWIGLNDIQKKGNFVWDSGKVSNFTKWAIGQPNKNQTFTEGCVLMVLPPWYKNGEADWNVQSCLDVNTATEHDGWICEYNKNLDLNAIIRRQSLYQPPFHAVRYFDDCPSHLTYWGYREIFKNKCYEFSMFSSGNGIQGDWYQAQLYCRTKGGYLVTIENKEEETFLINYLQKSYYAKTSVWIGLNDRNNDGNYTWDSGKYSLFSHWETGQPNLMKDPQCVSMTVPSNTIFNTKHTSPGWRSDTCLNTQQHHVNYGWICEYYLDRAQATTLPTGSVKTSTKRTEIIPTSTKPTEANKPTTEFQTKSTTTTHDTLVTTYEPFIIG